MDNGAVVPHYFAVVPMFMTDANESFLRFITEPIASAVLSRKPQSHSHGLAPDVFALWPSPACVALNIVQWTVERA